MIDKSVTGSDNLSSSGADSTPISTVPGGGSILPKSDEEIEAGKPGKANTPGQVTKQPDDAEALRAENARLRAGQSTLEERLESLRQIITKRQEGSTTPPPARSPQQPTIYKDEAGNLFTLDPRTGQAVPYTGGASASGSEADYDEKDTRLANLQLKDGVREVLDNYPNLDPEMKKRIVENPFGFWMWNYPDKKPETISAEEVLLDIEFKLMESSDVNNNTNNVPNGAANAGNQPGQGFSVAPSNRGPQVDLEGSPLANYVDEAGNFDIDAIWNALDSGEITLKDLEKVVAKTPMSEVLRGQKAGSSRGMFKKMI